MDLNLYHRVNELYLRHSQVITDNELEQWPGLYTEPCFYRVTSRTNYDRGLPLGTILCESRNALQDRVTTIRNTTVFAPRNILHTISNVQVVGQEDGALQTRSMFCIWQTFIDGNTHLLLAGRSFDRLVEDGGELKFTERVAVFDTELVPGAIVYPV